MPGVGTMAMWGGFSAIEDGKKKKKNQKSWVEK